MKHGILFFLRNSFICTLYISGLLFGLFVLSNSKKPGSNFTAWPSYHTRRCTLELQLQYRGRDYFLQGEKKLLCFISRDVFTLRGISSATHHWMRKKKKLFGLSGLTFEDDFLFLLYLEKYEDETLIYLNKCHAKILLSILACALVVIWCVFHHCFFFLFFFFSLVLFFFFSVCFSYLNAIS